MYRFKLYPDLPVPLIGYVLADLAFLFWIGAWLYIGRAIYDAVMTLSVIANGVIATGRNLNSALTQVQQAVNNLPLVGSNLRDDLTPIHGIPQGLIAQGYAELQAIHNLALLLGIVVAGVPVLAALLNYLPWRARKTRGFRNLNRMLRQPGASSIPATLHVLAGRALYTLPYDELLRYSPDPIGEWREGRHYNLARATMSVEGLDLRRYMRRMEGLEPPPTPHQHNLPTIGDE